MARGAAAGTGKLFHQGRWLVMLILLPAVCFGLWIAVTDERAVGWGIFVPIKVALIEQGTEKTPNAALETARMGAAANRLSSVASTTLLVFVSIGVGVYGWRSVWRSPTSRLDRSVIRGLTALLLLGVLLALDGNLVWEKFHLPTESAKHSDQVYRFLGEDVFERALGTLAGGNALALLKWQITIGNHAVALAAIGIVVSSSFIAIRATRLHGAADGPAAAELKNQLDLTLMIAAMLLVAGVIDTKQWTALPVPFIASKDMSTAYTSMINGFVALESVCFVGVLVSIFLPSALLLERARGRIRQASNGSVEAGSPPAPAAKPESLAFADLIRVVALLAPVLAGPIATFVNIKLPV